jgi:hypothetical protein
VDGDTATADGSIASVLDAIPRLFRDYKTLEAFLRTNLGEWLNNISNADKGLYIVALDLDKWAEKQDGGKRLVARLAATFPDDAGVKAMVTSLGINIADYPPKYAEFAGLTALAADPVGKQALVPYKLDLKQLCLIAIRIGGWKYLHDQVDFMRNSVVDPLDKIRTGPPDPNDLMNVLTIGGTLAKVVSAVTGKVDEMTLDADDVAWIDDNLLPAQEGLTQASGSWPAKDKLAPVVTDLSFITKEELAVLNSNIKTMAATIDSLNLPAKLDALTATIGSTPNAAQTATEIASVNTSVNTVVGLVIAHDRWQLVKDGFSGLLMALGSLDDARNAWGRIARKIEKIVDKPDDLLAAQADLVKALEGTDLPTLQRAIIALNAVVNNRFYAIDKDLLIAAGDLGKIGGGLQDVLETLDG